MADEVDRRLDAVLDEAFDEYFEETYTNIVNNQKKKQSRRAYVERNREEGHIRLWNDYFSENPTYPPHFFRRRFHMNKVIFMRIVDRLSETFPFFQQRRDATGRLGLSPLQKCTAALRMLAYGCAADAVDEYLRLGESTALSCLTNFTEGIIHLFGDEYLRRPTPEDLQRLLDIGEKRGFPGMIGASTVCIASGKLPNRLERTVHMWIRKANNCPGGCSFKRSLDMACFFGPPGTLNDINVLDRSPVFDDILQGRAPGLQYMVNGNLYGLPYYLTDGIYPRWYTFIQSISNPQSPEEQLFAKAQESTRKDVERAFGVLQS